MTYSGPARNRQELDAAMHLAAATFGTTLPESEQLERKKFLMLGNPRVRPEDVIVLCAPAGQVIGMVVLVGRQMMRDGDALPVVHITSVCLSEKARGQGLSRHLMAAALEACRSRGAALALLVARRAVDNYYNKFGFWGLSSYSSLAVRPLPAGRPSIRLAPASDNDLPARMEAYETCYNNHFGHHIRDETDWRYIREKSRLLQLDFLSVSGPGKLAGYILARQNRIFELGLSDPSRAREVVAGYASRQGLGQIDIDISRHHRLADHLGENAVHCSRECRYGGHMGAIVNTATLVETAASRIARRARIVSRPPAVEAVDGIEYHWDGERAHIIPPEHMDFAATARLIGATQLSTESHPNALDPPAPLNLLLADQV